MRRLRRSGFAGLPGVFLEGGDIGRMASYFQQEDARQAQSVAALGSLPATTASCDSCAPAGTEGPARPVRLSNRVAAKVLREMGAGQLAKLAVDGKNSELLEQVGSLAAGVDHIIKFKTDKIAVLSSLTSPMFAASVAKGTQKLHGLKGDERFRMALTLGYLAGAADVQMGRTSFYADAYHKSITGMSDVLRAAAQQGHEERAQKLLGRLTPVSKMGPEATTVPMETTTSLGALTKRTWNTKPPIPPIDTGLTAMSFVDRVTNRDDQFNILINTFSKKEQTAKISQATEQARRDIGTNARSPASIKVFSPVQAIVKMLPSFYALRSTARYWDGKNENGAVNREPVKRAIANGASANLDRHAAGTFMDSENLLVNWIFRWAMEHADFYPGTGINENTYSKFGGYDIIYDLACTWVSDDYYPPSGEDDEPNLRMWIYDADDEEYVGVSGRTFFTHVYVAYMVCLSHQRSNLINWFSGPKDQATFPMRLGAGLALAHLDALSRTGQTGSYVDGVWIPDKNGAVQIPPGKEAYAQWFSPAGPDNTTVRMETIPFIMDWYTAAYKRMPTRHALGWYGRMGYGVGVSYWDWEPNDTEAFKAAVTQAQTSDLGTKTPEDLRLASLDPRAEDLVDRSSWFAVIGRALGSVLASVLDAMAAGMDFVINMLCSLFKWMLGDTVGGVVCTILDAAIRSFINMLMGGIAAGIAILKSIFYFINSLMKGEILNAIKILMLGINQAIFFTIGGTVTTFTEILGGERMPFLESQENKMRADAKAAGLDPDDAVLPSMEKLAKLMTDENPFFVFEVIFAVIEVATSAGVKILKAIGRLVYALCPVMGYLLAPKVLKVIKNSDNPDLAEFKKLGLDSIRGAITAIAKLVAAVIMAIIGFSVMIKMLVEPWKRYVTRKKGVAGAIGGAAKYFWKKAQQELIIIAVTFFAAAKNGFADGPAMEMMMQALESLYKKLPQIIIGFAMDELEMSGEELDAFKEAVTFVFSSIEEARAAYEEAKAYLYGEGEEVPDAYEEEAPPPEDKKDTKKTKPDSRKLLPLLAAVGGLAVGYVLFSGDSDGA